MTTGVPNIHFRNLLIKMGILGVTGAILFLASYLGRLIYGGIYWGSIRKYPNFADSGIPQLKKLQKTSLLQWVFCLCVPFGSFVTSCQIIHKTSPSKCKYYKNELLALSGGVNDKYFKDLILELKGKYGNDSNDKLIEKYMDDKCKTPNTNFWIFLAIALFNFIFILIPLTYIYLHFR